MLYGKEMPDGLYKVNNKYGMFLVCKKYGDDYKERVCATISDCCDQVAEWDDIYRQKGILPYKSLASLNMYQVGRGRHASVVFYIYEAGTSNLVYYGTAASCASKFNTCTSSIYKCSNEAGILLKKFDVCTEPRDENYQRVVIDVDYLVKANNKYKYSKGVRFDGEKNQWIAYINQGKNCLYQLFDDSRKATIYFRDYLSQVDCVSA